MNRIPTRWRVAIALSIPLLLLVFGAVGYKAIGGRDWSWEDAFFMSAITLTTVGYAETHPLTSEGRIFTIVFLFGGVFTLFYTASEVIRAIVSGQLQTVLGRARMERTLTHMKGHTIVCGYGRMGRLVCQELERQEVPYVVIDRNAELLAESTFHHGLPLHGDATSDAVLEHAGAMRAKALVSVLPSDADNLYITLTARVMNEMLTIIARAEEEAAEAKLRRVGANQIVAPYVIGGRRVAQALLQPHVHDLLENVVRNEAVDYVIEEMRVEAGSDLCGVALNQTGLHEELGIVVLSIKRGQEAILNPKGGTVIHPGDVLIVVGQRQPISVMKERLRKPG